MNPGATLDPMHHLSCPGLGWALFSKKIIYITRSSLTSLFVTLFSYNDIMGHLITLLISMIYL